jgi:hypothetical protein
VLNKFSLVWICIAYPVMLCACGYYLATETFFSYAGFISIEVIVISSCSTVLMFADAVSVVYCKKVTGNIAVRSGIYDSEDEFDKKKSVQIAKGLEQLKK